MDKISNALREIALCYAAHDPMHPTSAKWVALAKLLEPERPAFETKEDAIAGGVPAEVFAGHGVPIEFREQPAGEVEVLRRSIDKLRQENADLALKLSAFK